MHESIHSIACNEKDKNRSKNCLCKQALCKGSSSIPWPSRRHCSQIGLGCKNQLGTLIGFVYLRCIIIHVSKIQHLNQTIFHLITKRTLLTSFSAPEQKTSGVASPPAHKFRLPCTHSPYTYTVICTGYSSFLVFKGHAIFNYKRIYRKNI